MTRLEGWTMDYLANSLWMVPLVFCAAWAAARGMRRVSVGAEHRVWVAALMLEAVLPGLRVNPAGMARAAFGMARSLWRGEALGQGVSVAFSAGDAPVRGGLAIASGVRAGCMAAYAGIVLYFAARLAWGLWRTRVARSEAEPVTEAAIVGRWRSHRPEGADLLCSASVGGPATVGLRRPALMVPRGFLEGLEAEEIDALMAHECAHMRRRDFAKNVLYSVLVLPASYHPGMWATWSRMEASREMVCDAMAAEAVEGRERYARSLLRLAASMIDQQPVKTIHAIGIFDANSLEGRIMELTGRSEAGRRVRAALVAGCVAMGVVTCASAMALRMEVGTAEEKSAEPPVLKVPAGVMAGQLVSHQNPVYPPEAKANHVEGAVVLKALISKEGMVQDLQVVSGPEELRGSSVEAVRQWRYRPFLLNGEPTEVETMVTITYHLAG